MKLETTPQWKALQDHYKTIKITHLRELFASDPARGSAFALQAGDIYADFSKNRLTAETLGLLMDLARSSGVEKLRDDMFAGAKINITEQRAVLHTALRHQSADPVTTDGQDVMPGVRRVLAQMGRFASAVRSGEWLGHTGK